MSSGCTLLIDIDECKYYPNACPADFNCKNTRGSYICECDDGYERAGNHCIGHYNISM